MLYALDPELVQVFSILFSSCHSNLNFSRPKNAFPEVVWLFWQSLICPCLHLVVNPLYLLLWSLLLIVDFDSDTLTSWRVFFTWFDVVKVFFFTMERILRSSTTVVLCGHPGLFMLLSSSVHFFRRMYQTVDLATPNVPAIPLMDLFCFWSLTIVCFTCMKSSFDRIKWVYTQQQLPNPNGTLRINSRPFPWLIDAGITEE